MVSRVKQVGRGIPTIRSKFVEQMDECMDDRKMSVGCLVAVVLGRELHRAALTKVPEMSTPQRVP